MAFSEAPQPRRRGVVTLAENATGPAWAAPWIGHLVVLGSRARRWSFSHPGRQLVIAVSVPARDFAAVLIGCGWMMAAPAPKLEPVRQAVTSLTPGTPVRVVTQTTIVTERFGGVDTERDR